MKIFRILIPVLLLSGWMMTSCDKLSEPYAAVKTEFDTTNKPFVLFEEYTGHKCNNCPLATMKAEKLADFYRGRMIVMSVHATDLADPDPKYTLDLRTPEGTLWCTDFALAYVPRALINRAIIGSSYPVNSDKWGEAIEAQLAKPIVTMIKAAAAYNSSGNEITASVTVWFKKSLSAGANINLYVLEDSIQGLQSNKDTAAGPTPDINPYYFNNTFRASMNGNFGELLTSSVEINKVYTYTKKFKVTNTDWDTDLLSLVATITDPTANPLGEIVGVTKVKIVTPK